MNDDFIIEGTELPVDELKRQIEYARVIGGDLFNTFSKQTERRIIGAYENNIAVQKLSMLLDFLFQANLWCEALEDDYIIFEKEKV